MRGLKSQVRVRNCLGLHTRPASLIVRLLQSCKSDVLFTYKSETVNARSILGILTLAVGMNSRLTITVMGEDAEETLRKLLTAFENRFENEI